MKHISPSVNERNSLELGPSARGIAVSSTVGQSSMINFIHQVVDKYNETNTGK